MDTRTIRAIAVVVSSEAGHCVEIFGQRVYRLEDGRYAVTDEGGDEILFKSAVKAAKYFERLRDKRKRGFDFERED